MREASNIWHDFFYFFGIFSPYIYSFLPTLKVKIKAKGGNFRFQQSFSPSPDIRDPRDAHSPQPLLPSSFLATKDELLKHGQSRGNIFVSYHSSVIRLIQVITHRHRNFFYNQKKKKTVLITKLSGTWYFLKMTQRKIHFRTKKYYFWLRNLPADWMKHNATCAHFCQSHVFISYRSIKEFKEHSPLLDLKSDILVKKVKIMKVWNWKIYFSGKNIIPLHQPKVRVITSWNFQVIWMSSIYGTWTMTPRSCKKSKF